MMQRNNLQQDSVLWDRMSLVLGDRPRQKFIALTLVAALLAFEAFNFDTTKFALGDLLGEINFLGMTWAGILAFAFCAIDFAGLVKIFTPEQGADEPKEVWYLMGAWLLGATMNAIMTWYAVSLILANQPTLGNEVVSRAQMLQIAPIFVAVLVWLTRILFIGSLSVAGDQLFHGEQIATPRPSRKTSRPTATANSRTGRARPAMGMQASAQPQTGHNSLEDRAISEPRHNRPQPPQRVSRVKRRPPTPMGSGHGPSPSPMMAKSRKP